MSYQGLGVSAGIFWEEDKQINVPPSVLLSSLQQTLSMKLFSSYGCCTNGTNYWARRSMKVVLFLPSEKVSSLGKDWHKFCLKCERCNKTLNPGGHAEHDGKPFCHKPCYAALFGPKGVNIGGAGSYVYDNPVNEAPAAVSLETDGKPEEAKKAPARGPVKAASFSSFSGGPNICPRCNKTVYFAEKVSSLGKNWHRPCLRCERCSKTLAPGSHAEHDGQPYCHKPCYAVLFGPKGVNTGGVGSYIYDEPEAEAQP
ncbi:cysteine-rich protein 2-like isoform X1 [Acanthopagrus latus]|uniref:cysteine-rich protein 2-like isoform X1 n=1 Tax=Acanthopagrus latus TaxID=8177 RepID=UPI00187C5486|nr:cysteine-rich protein 2-like isoform X1 [Acanthopagrus latus]